MRSFQNIVAILFAFFVCAFASTAPASDAQYEATVYVTSTVYRVNTVTLSGSSTASLANQTSTIAASHPSAAYPIYGTGNGTVVAPTGTNAIPSPPQFTGAASSLHANAFLAAFAAGLGYLVL
ncbi:hypothetical protein T440DRAFT_191925 [Plenodomus tracheiphilus IPT5]|uniref:Uncharacterized protein n=1 Tax=Plenodomus tracheiphilus IPT5 TaxID=1408161 RepID=A0A6A7AYK3_9PLEO|nr:hypothetical protein T440DRAFT_191925 [Plenodomus tracheiphilus IPT5]